MKSFVFTIVLFVLFILASCDKYKEYDYEYTVMNRRIITRYELPVQTYKYVKQVYLVHDSVNAWVDSEYWYDNTNIGDTVIIKIKR